MWEPHHGRGKYSVKIGNPDRDWNRLYELIDLSEYACRDVTQLRCALEAYASDLPHLQELLERTAEYERGMEELKERITRTILDTIEFVILAREVYGPPSVMNGEEGVTRL